MTAPRKIHTNRKKGLKKERSYTRISPAYPCRLPFIFFLRGKFKRSRRIEAGCHKPWRKWHSFCSPVENLQWEKPDSVSQLPVRGLWLHRKGHKLWKGKPVIWTWYSIRKQSLSSYRGGDKLHRGKLPWPCLCQRRCRLSLYWYHSMPSPQAYRQDRTPVICPFYFFKSLF